MKKQLLAICAVAVAFAAQAQSLQMQDMTSGNIIASGTTITENHADPNTFIDNHVDIINTTSSSINVKVRKTYLYFGTGMDATFCTGQLCYPNTVFLTPQTTPITGNNGILDLKVQYKPESVTPATTAIRYSIFNAANPADSVYFVIVYNGVTGIQQNTILPVTLSNASPNPASASFSMNYQLGNAHAGQLVMYNMLGEKVREMPLTEAEGTAKMDVSVLTQGVYFCSLTIDGKAVATRRIAVTR